ncbi:type II secretion system protein [Litoribacillus peritrichatus]|uniref:Prepilin-type N-terminal cleavage/methylation domain-containing protein n=1 Tax=Litoribacillus peritrichatus TaxID=718191 RepID=A0ABP7MSH5_9GAMM
MPKKSKGFTLIELVMVIIILGVLAATAIPRFADQSAYDERFFYENVMAGLRHAHKLAMSSGCRVQFQRSGTGFELLQDDNCFNAVAPAYGTKVLRPGGDTEYVVDGSTGDWDSDINPLIFTAAGQVMNSGGAVQASTTLTVGDRTIIIDGHTGYIR